MRGPSPYARGVRGLVGMLALAFLVGACGAGSAGDRGGAALSPASTGPSAFSPVSSTAPPKVAPSLSPAQRLELAEKAQGDAFGRGIVRLALPDGVGGRFTLVQGPVLPGTNESDLYLVARASLEITLPAPIAGRVVVAGSLNQVVNWVQIQQGNWIVFTMVPAESTVLVKAGDTIALGAPILSVKYLPDSKIQSTFESVGSKPPKGTFALYGSQDATVGPGKGFGQLTISGNVLADATGQALTIPVRQR